VDVEVRKVSEPNGNFVEDSEVGAKCLREGRLILGGVKMTEAVGQNSRSFVTSESRFAQEFARRIGGDHDKMQGFRPENWGPPGAATKFE
jgi:hypothetical protein